MAPKAKGSIESLSSPTRDARRVESSELKVTKPVEVHTKGSPHRASHLLGPHVASRDGLLHPSLGCRHLIRQDLDAPLSRVLHAPTDPTSGSA